MRKIYPAHQENKASKDYIEGPKAFERGIGTAGEFELNLGRHIGKL
jgi:hypothetical protein